MEEQTQGSMSGRNKPRTPPEDQWTSNLPTGQKAEYRRKRLPRGNYKIDATLAGTRFNQSKIVNYPVSRTDVETVFLSELMGILA